MSFFSDKQTLEDLNIPGRFKNNSIARLFDCAVTAGGRKLMDEYFLYPLSDEGEINKRSSIFEHFAKKPVRFPFSAEEFAIMESYLNSGSSGNILITSIGNISKKVLLLAAHDVQYTNLKSEICTTINLLGRLNDFAESISKSNGPYNHRIEEIISLLSHKKLNWLKQEQHIRVLPLFRLINYDHLFRNILYREMKSLIKLLFELDVYIAVAGVAAKQGFCFARAFPKANNFMTMKGLYHPAIERAKGNSLTLDNNCNVIFLTGANMAGKSTLMKSFGISIYLAHMGFPIAAEFMEFSVKDGLYSSINVPDNISLGHSHFYAEVLRVKTVAMEVAADKDLYVIFDELFKGTNVKDAYDATLTITEAFSENRNCFFFISTHITEVGEALRQQCDNFRFAYLPTLMDGIVPKYTYQLTEGITTDRHGMFIIENEEVLELILGEKPKNTNNI